MAYTKTVWQDRYIETPNKYQIVENEDNTVTITEVTGTVYTDGTDVNAEHMNNLENGVEDVDNRVTVLEQDTGWQDISYASGYSAGSGVPLKYRVKNGIVYMRGMIYGTFANASYVTVATIPSSITPNELIRSGAAGQQGKPALYEINPGGVIKISVNLMGSSVALPAWVHFNASYPID